MQVKLVGSKSRSKFDRLGQKFLVMWNSQIVTLAAIMLIVFGTLNTLISKATGAIRAPGLSETNLPFENPFFQVLFMFIGMTGDLVIHRVVSAGQPPSKQYSNTIFIAPAFFSLFASALMMASLRYLPASTYEMFRGSTLFWTAFLSFFVRQKYLSNKQLLGVLCVIIGLTLTGMSGTNKKQSKESGRDLSELTFGTTLVLMGSLCKAFMVISEEFYVSKYEVPPLVAVGYQGIWGSLMTALMLLVLHIWPGEHYGSMLNSAHCALQVANSPPLQRLLLSTGLCMAIYNFCGVAVSRALSASHRMVLDSLRLLSVWATALAMGMESLDTVTPVKAAGFSALVLGAVLYNSVGAARAAVPPKGEEKRS